MEPCVDWAKHSGPNTAAIHADAKIGWPNLDDEGTIWAPLNFPPRCTSRASAVGVPPPPHRARLDGSVRLDGERKVRTSRTAKPIHDGYGALK